MVFSASAVLGGVIVSTGTLLAVAGASKVYATVRGTEPDSAIRQALRVGPRCWRLAELGGGIVECTAGALVCSGILPRLGGVTTAGLGTAFMGLLLHARRAGATGGCGCFRWGRAKPDAVTWRVITRAGLIMIVGVLYTARPTATPPPFSQPWFYVGYGGGLILLASLSMQSLPDRLRCSWPWRPARKTFAALAKHPAFRAVAKSVGPFGAYYGYRRDRCSEHYWFATPSWPQTADRVVAFQVRHLPQGTLAVHASLQAHLPRNVHWRRWPGSMAWLEEPNHGGSNRL
jgi:hypothetical protein